MQKKTHRQHLTPYGVGTILRLREHLPPEPFTGGNGRAHGGTSTGMSGAKKMKIKDGGKWIA
jgi:hypothetical protein